MGRRVLYCANPECGKGIVIEREVPAICPKCGSSTWRCARNPSTPYTLTEDDKTFLRVNRIKP